MCYIRPIILINVKIEDEFFCNVINQSVELSV